MNDKYAECIERCLGTVLATEHNPGGNVWVYSKGNWRPSQGTERMRIEGLDLNLQGKVLHERVLFILAGTEIPIRSHEEVVEEIVTNIGDSPIEYVTSPGPSRIIKPRESMHSVKGTLGFFHGFYTESNGLLYVAKALHPNFVNGNSFRMPENTYRPDPDK